MKKKTKNRSDAELREICTNMLASRVYQSALIFNLTDFKKFCSLLVENRQGYVPTASVANLGKDVFIQFSEISPQHFLISSDSYLSEDDFDFLLTKKWYGPKSSLPNFPLFFIEELKLNKWVLAIIFFLSSFLLYVARRDTLYAEVSSLLLQASTVFLSIYLIFTVTQNQFLQSDKRLFQQGLMQKFHADDRNLTMLAILTIVLSILNVIFSASSPYWGQVLQIDKHIVLSVSTAIIICLLIDTFLAVVNYYLERVRGVMERNIVSAVLHEDFLEYHPESDKNSGSQNK